MGDTATLPEARDVFDRASGENFSVASVVLGAAARRHLLAIYGYARLVDQIGDAVAGDRLALLDGFELDLDRIFTGGEPSHPVLRRLEPTVHELGLPREPFARLIEANRRDQEDGRLRDLRRPARLLRPLGEPGRRARPPRLRRRHARPDRALESGLLGAAAGRALAGRRRGPGRRADLPARRGPRPVRGRRLRPGRSRHRPLAARADGVRGRPCPRAPRRGRSPRRAASRTRADRGRRLCRRRAGRARGDRGLGLRRPRRAAAGTSRPPGLVDLARSWPAEPERAERRAGLRALPRHRPRLRLELLRGHATARPGAPRCALRRLRAGAPDRRHRRRRARGRTTSSPSSKPCAAGSAPRRGRRAGARRARRRGPAVSDPARCLRRPGRRRGARRARHRVRHLRRARPLLPLRRRLDRAPVARRLRLLRPRARQRARRRARGRPPDRERAARHRRGRRRTAASTCLPRISGGSAARPGTGRSRGRSRT